jgi:hypothetical protein
MAVGKKSADPAVKGIEVRLIDMTPDIAEDLLDENLFNRKVRVRAIDELVEALRLGDWQFNGDPVRIADSGRLLDGQHRLMAIVEANVTVPVVLITGIPDKAQMTMDAGVKRTYADHLQLNGETQPNSLGAIIASYRNYAANHGKVNWTGTGGRRASIAQLDRFFAEHQGLREADHIAGNLYQKLRVSRPAIGIAYYVMQGLNPEDCDFFWERVANGDQLSNDDTTQPILKLREYLLNKHAYDHRKLIPTLCAIFKTWNAYREGRPLNNAVPKLGGAKPERFPWPK